MILSLKGDPASKMYFIGRGTIKKFSRGDSDEALALLHQEGTCLGELALFILSLATQLLLL